MCGLGYIGFSKDVIENGFLMNGIEEEETIYLLKDGNVSALKRKKAIGPDQTKEGKKRKFQVYLIFKGGGDDFQTRE